MLVEGEVICGEIRRTLKVGSIKTIRISNVLNRRVRTGPP